MKKTADTITTDEIIETHARGGVSADTAHVALHGHPEECAVARAKCAEAFNKLPKIVDTGEPEPEYDPCLDCGATEPHFCQGVPGGFSDDENDL